MGTWGEGIYDNDSALDGLADLVKVALDEPDVVRLVTRIGLALWLDPVPLTHEPTDLQARLDALEPELASLPEATRAALAELRADPKAATKPGSRSEAARRAIGGYSDGRRVDALLRLPGAQPVIDELAANAIEVLERALSKPRDLYEAAGDVFALGVLIELAEAELWRPSPERVNVWRATFAALDKATKEERGFWWKYVGRVRAGFDLLAPAPAHAATPLARPTPERARVAPPGPVQRFKHAKFGPATLLSRSGAGEAEVLELLFDDGTVRKIAVRFVVPLES